MSGETRTTRTTRTSQKVRIASPDPIKAVMLKYKIISENEKLTQVEYNYVLELFKNDLASDEYEIFKKDLDEALNLKEDLNTKLTKGYYNEQILLHIILYVFTSILPGLIKANIPDNIALFVIFALRVYNFQLLNYYYRFFVDPNNPGIKHLHEGKPLRLKQITDLYSHALESSKNTRIFAEGHFSLIKGLIKIKSDVETFMDRKQIFANDSKFRFRFVFLYLAIFIVMLYIAIHINIDELKNVLNFLNTTHLPQQQPSTQSFIGRTPSVTLPPQPSSRVTELGGGKKNIKSKKSTKLKKRVAITKKASPKKIKNKQ